MKHLSLLIKPASSACNLACRYCFYHDVSEQRSIKNYGIMSEATMQGLIDNALAHGEESITFAFQGGEPTLATLPYFERFVDYVNQHKDKQHIHYVIQSNGTLIDEKWATFFKQHDFLVGISLDGYQSNHDTYRYDKQQKSVYFDVKRAIALLTKHAVRYNILCVLTKQLATHAKALYQYLKQNKYTYVQFIPCLDDLNNHHRDALDASHFYQFYRDYFALWYRDVQAGYYQSVNLFDNLLLMLSDQAPYQCGMLGFCSCQFVVESNGDVYPCDFYVLDEYRMGNVSETSLVTMMQSHLSKQFLQDKGSIHARCEHCRYANLCHGGCKRMRHTLMDDTICGYQMLLADIIPSLLTIRK